MRLFMSVLYCLLIHTSALRAGDWPQILGPNRDGNAAADERLADTWPNEGPTVAWQRDVGGGFAGVAVAKQTAVLFHRIGDEEVVEALDATTGKTKWKTGFATSFTSGYTDDNGPRCVPIIHGEQVIVFGVQGRLCCLDLRSGQTVWQRATHAEFNASEGYFGAGSSPIIVDDKVLVNVGAGRGGAGVVAFDLNTGKTIWQATDELASYSSPVATTVDNVRHVIFITRMKTLSLDPSNGHVRFEFPFGKRGPTVNAASPIIYDGHLFVTAHYGVGAIFAKIQSSAIDELWQSDDVISSHYMTCLVHDGLFYGIHGQERLDDPELRCFDPRTHQVLWSKPRFGFGSILQADGKFVMQTTDGELILWKPNAKRFQELARARLFRGTTRALPALSEGRLLARDSKTLKCISVK